MKITQAISIINLRQTLWVDNTRNVSRTLKKRPPLLRSKVEASFLSQGRYSCFQKCTKVTQEEKMPFFVDMIQKCQLIATNAVAAYNTYRTCLLALLYHTAAPYWQHALEIERSDVWFCMTSFFHCTVCSMLSASSMVAVTLLAGSCVV